ncbi:hypothetical protein ASZ78_016698 [Callipepla squamata]|uniref:Cadherin domain-containing protein n=1 Tax=Callipepla squamata TaxID=9009 RepID=A0A226MC22_CALSU|nr:hypothetical protein ASZ78_016698 [Callipepla squamata]
MARRRAGRCPDGLRVAPSALPPLLPAVLLLLPPLWLRGAAAGAGPVYNLTLAVAEGLPAGTLVRPDTGEIRTARRLDRERRARYSFAAATLRGDVVRVEIAVADANDHPPRFPRGRLRLDVSELSPPGSAFRLPPAKDPDAGRFGTQGYALLEAGGAPGEPPLFAPPRRGRLRVAVRVLDENDNAPAFGRADISRRQSDPGGFFAVEERSGPEVSAALVSVAVLDVNDNAPTVCLLFLTESGGPRISEGARPGAYVARVSVSDADEASGGAGVALALRGGDGAFSLRPAAAGVFFLCVATPLDRERRELYALRLVARDGGTPPLSAERALLLRVVDVNDEAPVFARTLYRAAVSEAAAPGTTVLRVSASDGDEPGSPNAEVRYALQGEPGVLALLHIDARSGAVSTRWSLDRERLAALELRVVARDGGRPQRSSWCRLSIRVQDANDNEPRFQRRVYRGRLPEHAAPGRCPLQKSGLEESGRNERLCA